MEANQNKYLWALAALAVVGGALYYFSDKPKGIDGAPKQKAKSIKRKAK